MSGYTSRKGSVIGGKKYYGGSRISGVNSSDGSGNRSDSYEYVSFVVAWSATDGMTVAACLAV